MAGFEVIVRPVVFPNIRPAPPRVLPPQDDPTKGACIISGSGGGLIDLPHTWSVSVSKQKPHQETVREIQKEKVMQVDDKGKINEDNFVEVERLTNVRFDKTDGPYKVQYADPPPRSNVLAQERYTRYPKGTKNIYRGNLS